MVQVHWHNIRARIQLSASLLYVAALVGGWARNIRPCMGRKTPGTIHSELVAQLTSRGPK
jgi:hypothetical protein